MVMVNPGLVSPPHFGPIQAWFVLIFDLSPAISQSFSKVSLASSKKRGGEHEVAGYIYAHGYTYGYENASTKLIFSSKISSTFPELTNDFKKLCKMAGDRSKIETNHAWMGPKLGGDTRAYTVVEDL